MPPRDRTTQQDRDEARYWTTYQRRARQELAAFEADTLTAGLRRLRSIPDDVWQRAEDEDAGPEMAEGSTP